MFEMLPGNFLPFINSSESNYLTMSVSKETKLHKRGIVCTQEFIAVVGLCQALNSRGAGGGSEVGHEHGFQQAAQ